MIDDDAPSLAAADASRSPVTAVHLTQAAAEAVFLRERLDPIVDMIVIARRAKRLMRENLGLALANNMIAVPIAIQVRDCRRQTVTVRAAEARAQFGRSG